MANERDASPWLVVDHELLSRLGPASPRAEWERTLRRTGLWELDALGGAEGKDLATVRSLVGAWPEAAPVSAPGALGGAWTVAPLVILFGGLYFALTGTSASSVLLGMFVAAVFAVLAAALWSAAAATPGKVPGAAAHADDATRALRRFLSHTFVEVAGGKIVENTPHRVYLELRLEDIDRALRAADGKLAEMAVLRKRIRDTNSRMGRAPDDVETNRLTAAIGEQESARERVRAVRALLAVRLHELDAQLERLRAIAERRALSERVSQLTDGAGAHAPEERVAADIEVDVAEIEGRVRELALEVGEADARLGALLEVVGASQKRG